MRVGEAEVEDSISVGLQVFGQRRLTYSMSIDMQRSLQQPD